jgi:molybdopterin converting factor subunit 1
VKIEVRLFAMARDLAGSETVQLELPSGATLGDLRSEFLHRYPSFSSVQRHLLFAVNAEYADDKTPLNANDEVACIPPVSGG